MKKQTKKQLQDFNNEAIEILEFYGASKIEDPHTNLITYKMDSDELGELIIRLDYEPSKVYTIMAKFEEPIKAIKHFNINPYSGKLNSHEWMPEPCLMFIDSLLDNYNQINGINVHAEYLQA